VRYKRRDLLFREAVLHFLGCADKPDPHEAYCQVCRDLGEDDCANCDRGSIRVLNHE
jgi:hypothetical protein